MNRVTMKLLEMSNGSRVFGCGVEGLASLAPLAAADLKSGMPREWFGALAFMDKVREDGKASVFKDEPM